MKKLFLAMMLTVIFPVLTHAVPTTPTYVTIKEMRAFYTGGTYVTTVESNPICGTTVFLISNTAAGNKEMYSLALAAMMNATPVKLEVISCSGWGSQLRSIFVKP